jgi:hypothetical protein
MLFKFLVIFHANFVFIAEAEEICCLDNDIAYVRLTEIVTFGIAIDIA